MLPDNIEKNFYESSIKCESAKTGNGERNYMKIREEEEVWFYFILFRFM